MTVMRTSMFILLPFCAVAACTPFPEGQRRVESLAELQEKQSRDFAKSPDMQLPELRQRLLALGVKAGNMTNAIDSDYGVPILLIGLEDAEYQKLDKPALAKLELDSRYRFRLTDPWQIRDFADYSVKEDFSREQAVALKELADKGEMDRFPKYVRGRSMNIYARQLEAYCGYGPGEALSVADGKWLQYENKITSDAVMAGAESQSHASFACLRRIVYATDLRPHFIGNRPRPGAINS